MVVEVVVFGGVGLIFLLVELRLAGAVLCKLTLFLGWKRRPVITKDVGETS